MTRYVCEECGQQGEADDDVDRILCPHCGEPVTPLD